MHVYVYDLYPALQTLFSLCLLHTRVSGSSNIYSSSSSSSLATSSSSSSGRRGREAAALVSEMRLVREDMAWWMSHKPEVGLSEGVSEDGCRHGASRSAMPVKLCC